MNIEVLKEAFIKRGFSFDIFVDPPGQRWMGFTHPVDEIVVVLEGEITLTVDAIALTPKIGEEVFIPAHALHDVITSNNSGSRWAYGYKNKT